MRNLILAAVLSALSGAAAAGPIGQGNGSITFVGELVDQTCEIETDDRQMTVTLPHVSVASLASGGDTAGETPFTIRLKNCTLPKDRHSHKTVKPYFSIGSQHASMNSDIDDATGLLNNKEGEGFAGNVKIQLINRNATRSLVSLNKDVRFQNVAAPTIQYTGNTGEAKLQYIARYYATGKATPGRVESRIVYELHYE